MDKITKNKDYNSISALFDTTAIESPYYETSSIKGTLIEEMKNNILVIEETIIIDNEIIIKDEEIF